MAFATKKELMYVGIITVIFLIIVIILSLTLPLKVDLIQQDTNDINNFNPAYDSNTETIVLEQISIEDKAKNLCVKMCNDYKDPVSYSEGPCLSDRYGFSIEDWVCDIVNVPRTDIDKENQCKTFVNGNANHFVEVDTNCNFVRLY